MRLYVIRHGESVINVEPWDKLDDLDTALTPLGVQQAEALRDWFEKKNIKADALYASTLKRTRETAGIVAQSLGADIVFDDRLREVGNNYADGTPVDSKDMPRKWRSGGMYKYPFDPRSDDLARMESWTHFRLRVALFVEELKDKHLGEDVYVVAHGGVVHTLMEHVFNTGPYKSYSVHTYNTGWSCVEYQVNAENQGFWTLLHHNCIDHLDGIDY